MSTLEPIRILHLTDLHYDPLYQVGALGPCEFPVCCQADSGNVTFPGDAAGHWGDYNYCDTPWHAVEDILNQNKLNHVRYISSHWFQIKRKYFRLTSIMSTSLVILSVTEYGRQTLKITPGILKKSYKLSGSIFPYPFIPS